MKSEHRIPLRDAACALLRAVKGDGNPAPDELIFRGQKGRSPSFLEIARRLAAKMSPPIGETEISAHGFRSSFRT
jgi:integrase